MKIKLVVVNEHTLGYIQPELPNYVGVLHASILKGSPILGSPLSSMESILINNSHVVRLASKKDFDDFNHASNGYFNPELYEFKTD